MANMEAFLANLKVILPVVGLDLLKPRPAVARPSNDPFGSTPSEISLESAQFEIRHRSGVKALAVEEGGEFVVLAGSQALRDTGYSNNTYGALKQELIAKSVLKEDVTDQDVYVFAEPYAFSSPSAASAVVLDRNSNGRIEWKDVDSPLNYHQWQEKQAAIEEAIPESKDGI